MHDYIPISYAKLLDRNGILVSAASAAAGYRHPRSCYRPKYCCCSHQTVVSSDRSCHRTRDTCLTERLRSPRQSANFWIWHGSPTNSLQFICLPIGIPVGAIVATLIARTRPLIAAAFWIANDSVGLHRIVVVRHLDVCVSKSWEKLVRHQSILVLLWSGLEHTSTLISPVGSTAFVGSLST